MAKLLFRQKVFWQAHIIYSGLKNENNRSTYKTLFLFLLALALNCTFSNFCLLCNVIIHISFCIHDIMNECLDHRINCIYCHNRHITFSITEITPAALSKKCFYNSKIFQIQIQHFQVKIHWQQPFSTQFFHFQPIHCEYYFQCQHFPYFGLYLQIMLTCSIHGGHRRCIIFIFLY